MAAWRSKVSGEESRKNVLIKVLANGLENTPDFLSKSFVGAINRLITGITDIPVTLLAGVKQRFEDDNARRRLFSQAMTKAALKQAVLDESEVQRVLDRMIAEGSRSQKNREKIARFAIEEAAVLERSKSYNKTTSECIVDDDWITRFISLSENVSNEDVQRIWGKVLAREAAAPGLFSFSTLRILSELDRVRAMRFQRMLRHSFGGAIPRSRLGSDNDNWHNIRMLIQDGLIAPSEGTKLVRSLHISSEYVEFGWIGGRDYNLEVYGSDIRSYVLPAVFLTDAGIELARLVSATGEEHVAQSIANERQTSNLDGFILRPKLRASPILSKPLVLWSRASEEVFLRNVGHGSADFERLHIND